MAPSASLDGGFAGPLLLLLLLLLVTRRQQRLLRGRRLVRVRRVKAEALHRVRVLQVVERVVMLLLLLLLVEYEEPAARLYL